MSVIEFSRFDIETGNIENLRGAKEAERERVRKRRENNIKKKHKAENLVKIMNPWIGALYIKNSVVKNTNVSKKEYKKHGNKRVRQCIEPLNTPGAYKKVYDLWWEVY